MTDKRKVKRFSAEEKEEIVTAAAAGTGYRELADRLGCSPAAISQVALKAGIRRRNGCKVHAEEVATCQTWEPETRDADEGADDAA